MELIPISALTISFFALIGTIINSVFIVKTYKKNRRLEFLQRRDHLSQKISDLNDINAEGQLFSAKYALVAVRNAGLRLSGEQAEQNAALIASIKVQPEGVENGMKLFNETIERLHFKYSNLTSETDAPEVERLIVAVKVASDELKSANNGYSSVLHIPETTNEIVKAKLDESDEEIRRINLDFERAIAKLR